MRINPLSILLFNIVMPISVMIPGNNWKFHFFLALASTVLLLSGKFVRLVKFAAFITATMLLRNMVDYITGNPGNMVSLMLLVNLHFIPCIMMASILVLDYTPSEIISAIQPLHLPKIFVVSLVVTIRYIPTFKREFPYIREAMRLRGISFSLLRPIQSFSLFIVPQLFRCQILSDEITSAGMTKGITNPAQRTSWYRIGMGFHDWALCAVIIIGTAAFTLFRT